MQVEECTTVIDELVAAMAALIPQLSSSNPPPDADQPRRDRWPRTPAICCSPATTTGPSSDPSRSSCSPSRPACRAWIEDVVVDGAARGRGVGEELNRFALDLARSLGARTVDLTSRPSREAANRLYQRIGFEARDTNVYRIAVGHQTP